MAVIHPKQTPSNMKIPASSKSSGFLYGGPNPLVTRAHASFCLVNFLVMLLMPFVATRSLLADTDASASNKSVMFMSKMWGLAGVSLCVQLLVEPILTKRQSLMTGLVSCTSSVLLLHNRNLMSRSALFYCFYFSLMGIYFVIRSPNARSSFQISDKDTKSH